MVPLLGTEFVPKADFSETSVTFHTPVGSSLETTESRAAQVEAIVREFPEVQYTLTTINTGNAQGKIYANVYVRLVDRKERTVSVDAMSARLRERLRQVAGINVTHVGLLDPVGGQKALEFSLQGSDLKELERLSQQVLDGIRGIPGLVDLDASVKPNKPTVDIALRRDLASDAGVGVASVASSLRTLVAGTTVGNWRAPDDQTYDVNVRLPAADRARLADLSQLPLVTGTQADGSAHVVRLGQVAEVREATGANQINRRNLTREVSISANAYARSSGVVSADIRQVLDGIAWPPGYRYEFGGSTKNMQESFGYAISALVLAIVFIYMILASQFKSFLQPLALMSSLPLTLIGVVLALLMFRSSLSMFSIIGVVMLMGLVTKNAILLVDFAIRAREGTPAPPATGPRGSPVAGRPRAAAPHPHDHPGHGLRHGAAGLCPDRRLGAARAHGPGGDRGGHHLLAADPGGGARGVLLHGRPGGLGPPPHGPGPGSPAGRGRAGPPVKSTSLIDQPHGVFCHDRPALHVRHRTSPLQHDRATGPPLGRARPPGAGPAGRGQA